MTQPEEQPRQSEQTKLTEPAQQARRERRRAQPRKSQVPVAVSWLCGLQLVLLVAHSLLAPTWRGPDEPNHVDLVVALRDDGSYPDYDERRVDPGIRASLDVFQVGRESARFRADEARPRSERPSRVDLATKGESVDLGRLGRPGTRNHMSQHPPGYYAVLAALAGGVDTLLPGDGFGSVDQEVGALRLLSLLVLVPLPLVAWWVAREVGLGPGAALAAAVLPLAVPQLTHVGAVVNNDSLLILLCGILTGLVVRIARGRVDARTMVLAGVVSGAALLVKALAFVLPIWVLIAFVVGWRRARRHGARARSTGQVGGSGTANGTNGANGGTAVATLPRAWYEPVVTYLGCTMVAGGWWWIANQVRYGDVAPSIEYVTRLSRPESGTSVEPIEWNGWFHDMWQRYWGAFGWIEVPVPGWLVVAATVLVVGGIALAFWARRGTSQLRPGLIGVLLAPTLLLGGFVAANGYRLYQHSGFMTMVQGRYLFGGLIGLVVVVASGWSKLRPSVATGVRKAGRWPATMFLTVALVAQVVAMLVMLNRWWGARSASLLDRLGALTAWSPWPAPVVWLVVVLLVAVSAFTMASILGGVGSPRPPEPSEPPSPVPPADPPTYVAQHLADPRQVVTTG